MPVRVAAAMARRKSSGVVAGAIEGQGGVSDQKLMAIRAAAASPPTMKA